MEVISMSEIKELLAMWEKFTDFVERKHPENVATDHVIALVNDTCLMHFKNILKGRKNKYPWIGLCWNGQLIKVKRAFSKSQNLVTTKINLGEKEVLKNTNKN